MNKWRKRERLLTDLYIKNQARIIAECYLTDEEIKNLKTKNQEVSKEIVNKLKEK